MIFLGNFFVLCAQCYSWKILFRVLLLSRCSWHCQISAECLSRLRQLRFTMATAGLSLSRTRATTFVRDSVSPATEIDSFLFPCRKQYRVSPFVPSHNSRRGKRGKRNFAANGWSGVFDNRAPSGVSYLRMCWNEGGKQRAEVAHPWRMNPFCRVKTGL